MSIRPILSAVVLLMPLALSACGPKPYRLALAGIPRYTAVDLGDANTVTEARGINERGQIAGSVAPPDGGTRPCYWDGGRRIDLKTFGGESGEAADMNEQAWVVGWAETNSSTSHAFLYRDGRMTDLGTLGGRESKAYALNNRGQVVGWSGVSPKKSSVHAFLWDAGKMRDLGTLGGDRSEAWAINDSGVVAGLAETTEGFPHAFVWKNGRMHDLGTLGGTNSEAYGVNAAGQVVGWAGLDPKHTHIRAFLWADDQMRDLGRAAQAHAINDRGQLVGLLDAPHDGSHAFLWSNGWLVPLNDLLLQGTKINLDDARGINNAGQIIATATVTEDGRKHAYLLTPQSQVARE